MCTAITPAIYKAQETLKLARQVHPDALTVLGGIHGTFMFAQVLDEAPWIDVVVRGEGEEIVANLARAVDAHRAGDLPSAQQWLQQALDAATRQHYL